MSAVAGELQPVLEEKSQATAELLVTVAKDREEASKVQRVVEKDAGEVEAFQKEVQAIADDAKADLAEALPVLESAVKSLNALNKNDIVEMKSFSKPPPLVMLTMEAVCTLRQEKPDWDSAKRMLGDSSFMEALKTFDKEHIPDGVIKKLKKYVVSDITSCLVASMCHVGWLLACAT
jgi:dynein heavy chain, axonemal